MRKIILILFFSMIASLSSCALQEQKPKEPHAPPEPPEVENTTPQQRERREILETIQYGSELERKNAYRTSINELRGFGFDVDETIDGFLDLLENDAPAIRELAALALMNSETMGRELGDAFKNRYKSPEREMVLNQWMQGDYEQLRQLAALVLENLEWEAELDEEKKMEYQQAVDCLKYAGFPDADTLTEFVEPLDSESITTRKCAFRAIFYSGDDWVQNVTPLLLDKYGKDKTAHELVGWLADDDWGIRGFSFAILSALGTESAKAIPELIVSYKNAPSNFHNLSDYLDLFRQIDARGSTVIPEFRRMFQSDIVDQRERGLLGLTAYKADSEKVIPVLLERLSEEDEDIFSSAVQGIAEYGPAASKVAPAIVELMADLGDDYVSKHRRADLTSALEALGAGAAPAIIDSLKAYDPHKQYDPADLEFLRSNLFTLGNIAPELPDITKLIASFLESPSPGIRGAAAYSIGRFGAAASDTVDALIKDLNDADDGVRFNVAMSLGYIGEAASGALQKLDEMKESDRNSEVRLAAAEAVMMIKKEGEYSDTIS